MNSRERLLTAMRGGIPDRVPVVPDISNLIPCRLTGKPFWNIYYHADPPLWRAYLDAANHFGIDHWFNYGEMRFTYANRKTEEVWKEQTEEHLTVRYAHHNPAGTRYSTVRYPRDGTPVQLETPIKDLRADFDWLRASYELPSGYTPSLLAEQRAALGPHQALCIGVDYPGLQHWVGMVEGSLEALVGWVYDEPALIDAWREMMDEKIMAMLDMILTERPDYITLNGSGTITLQSPKLARRLSLPTVQKVTRRAREAGIPTMLHSCGKSKAWVEMLANETDLNCVNPLEIPPMGDADLAEMKRIYGKRLCLMGNLHTTEVMLFGTPAEVKAASRRAIEDAAEGGGFILSTGDQCGRDTPEANIFAMVEAAEEYGRY